MDGSNAGGSGGGGGGRAADYAPVEVDFTPDPGFQLLFDGLRAEEELGRPFLFTLDLSSGKLLSDVSKIIGSACSIWMYRAEDKEHPDRYFHGIVTNLSSAGLTGGAYRYKLEVRPWIYLLSHHVDCRIFQKKSAFQIVTEVFRTAGFSDFQDKRQGGNGDIVLEYTVQYNESSFAFVTRLMEQYGFYYFFTYTKTAHTLVLADDPNCHTLIEGEFPYKFDQTEYRTVVDHIWQWATDHQMNSGKFTSQDYNFTTPSADLTAKNVDPQQNQYGQFEHYDYPGTYETTPHGAGHSDVRMQDLIARRIVYSAMSNSRKLDAGWRFTLSNYPDKAANKAYLITKSVTTLTLAEGSPNPDTDTVDSYRVEFQCIPGDTPFRLQRTTARPMIRGSQTAKVVGKSGDEITTDNYGRVKVKFHWDRSSTEDYERTCWIRVSQSWAGAGHGSQFIPRVGQEVVVTHLEGNPDRPLVTGTVHNGNNAVPHTLPDHKTRTVIRSNSTGGGGGFNELHMEDSAGDELLYMHAQKDFKRDVLHDEIATIKNDRNVTITGGSDTLDISAGGQTVTAQTSITLQVGGSSVKIDAGGVTITGGSFVVQA